MYGWHRVAVRCHHGVIDKVSVAQLLSLDFDLIILSDIVCVMLLDNCSSNVLSIDLREASNEVLSSNSTVLSRMLGVAECRLDKEFDKSSELFLAETSRLVDRIKCLKQLFLH